MPLDQSISSKVLVRIVAEVGLYPIDAYEFVEDGLLYTVRKTYGPDVKPGTNHHVSGQQLCIGLREYSLLRWGLLGRVVLRKWNIQSTADFGRIVFAMIDSGHMRKSDHDTLDDFTDVYDFATGFDSDYRIEARI